MVFANTVISRLCVWTMALAPLSLSVLAHTGFRPVPLSIPSPKLPSLSFHQYAVDLKTIRPTSVEQTFFAFHNRGTEPVRITKIEPSCGCLTPQLQGVRDNVVEPGEGGRVIFRMQPANSTPGPHQYTVTVRYTDPEPREVQLLLKLVIPATLWVTPPAVSIFHPKGASPTVQEFTITDGRGTPFDITDVSINTDLVEVAIGESNRSNTGMYQQTVKAVIASELPPGRSMFLLRVQTTDPDVPELRIPVRLEGPTEAGADHLTEAVVPARPQSAAAKPDTQRQ